MVNTDKDKIIELIESIGFVFDVIIGNSISKSTYKYTYKNSKIYIAFKDLNDVQTDVINIIMFNIENNSENGYLMKNTKSNTIFIKQYIRDNFPYECRKLAIDKLIKKSK